MTTAASGDVKRQALVFVLSLVKCCLCGGGLRGSENRLLLSTLLWGPRDVAISGWTFAISHGRKEERGLNLICSFPIRLEIIVIDMTLFNPIDFFISSNS